MQVNATPSLSHMEVVCDMPGLTSRAGAALLTGLAGHVADDFHVRKRRCSVHLHGDPPERGLRVLITRIIPAREDF